MRNMDIEGYSNLFLVKLRLDRLGPLDRQLWSRGLISSIYIIDAPPQEGESSSLKTDVSAAGECDGMRTIQGDES